MRARSKRFGIDTVLGLAAALALAASLWGAATASAQPVAAAAAAGVTERTEEPGVKLAADIFETIDRVPVDVKLPNGTAHRGDMVVTHFRPAGTGPFPLVVMSHGRAAATRHEPGRWRTLPVVRYWIRRGFAVMVPTRIGYGALGQEVDPEASGVCSKAEFRPAVEAMAKQIGAAVAFAAKLPWIDSQRVVLSGVSYGGFGTISAVGRRIPGVIGAINFAGGLGGSPERRPGDPCQGSQIEALAKEAGAKARVPTLWLYSRNDRYWGEAWPRRWYEAFTAAGGKARFEAFDPIGEDGHKLMSQGFTAWRPVVDRFVASLGIEPPRSPSIPPSSGFAAIEDMQAVPHIKAQVKTDGYAKFLAADLPRAFAVSPTGAWAWRSGLDAVEVAIKRCQTNSRSPCALYAVDDRVVWKSDRR